MQFWIVGRHRDPENAPLVWEFMGVFDAREKAIDACASPFDFIGPAILNERCPDEASLWPGIEYPLNEST